MVNSAVYTVERRSYTRLWILIVALAVLVVVAVVVAMVVMTGRPERVPAGRTIAGVTVGGLDERELRAAVESSVRTRVEQMVTVRVTGTDRKFTFAPAESGITLDVDATVRAAFDGTGTAVVAVDPAKLREALAAQRQAATDTVVKLAAPASRLEDKGDASFTASTAGVDRTAGTAGWTIDPAAASTALETAVKSGRPEASVASTPVASKTEPAEFAGVDQLIGTFTTYHPCCAPRVTNIHLIAKIVDGTVIKPGRRSR